GDFDGFGLVGDGAVAAGNDGDAAFAHGFAGEGFVAHGADGGRFRADELDVARFALLGEIGVFGEEAVAGVDGVDVGDFGGADDPVGFQITGGGGGRADADGFIGQLHGQGLDVGFRIDGEGFD